MPSTRQTGDGAGVPNPAVKFGLNGDSSWRRCAIDLNLMFYQFVPLWEQHRELSYPTNVLHSTEGEGREGREKGTEKTKGNEEDMDATCAVQILTFFNAE